MTTIELPIPPDQIAGPIHPILANYLWWLIKRQKGDKDAERFGNQLLAYLGAEGAPVNRKGD